MCTHMRALLNTHLHTHKWRKDDRLMAWLQSPTSHLLSLELVSQTCYKEVSLAGQFKSNMACCRGLIRIKGSQLASC